MFQKRHDSFGFRHGNTLLYDSDNAWKLVLVPITMGLMSSINPPTVSFEGLQAIFAWHWPESLPYFNPCVLASIRTLDTGLYIPGQNRVISYRVARVGFSFGVSQFL